MKPRFMMFFAPVIATILATVMTAFAQFRESVEMIRIPAGTFLMGSNSGPEDERPQHRVEVAEFFIDRTKVTNSQFALFLNAIGPSGPQNEKYFDIRRQ